MQVTAKYAKDIQVGDKLLVSMGDYRFDWLLRTVTTIYETTQPNEWIRFNTEAYFGETRVELLGYLRLTELVLAVENQ